MYWQTNTQLLWSQFQVNKFKSYREGRDDCDNWVDEHWGDLAGVVRTQVGLREALVIAEEALDVDGEGVCILKVVSQQHRPSHDHQLEIEHYPGVRKWECERQTRGGRGRRGLGEEEGRVKSLFPSVTGRCIGNPKRGRMRGSRFGSKTEREREREKEEAFPRERMKEEGQKKDSNRGSEETKAVQRARREYTMEQDGQRWEEVGGKAAFMLLTF